MLRKKKLFGDVYIGLIIALGILAILSQTVISLVFTSYDLLNYTSARTTAKFIATEKMEIIHNLAFDDIGVVGGIPNGILAQNEKTVRNGLDYNVNTRVNFIDDSFDGLAPSDTVATDYKRVRIEVSWGGITSPRGSSLTLVTDIAPRGVESPGSGGTLSIFVFDSNGNPVPQADVQIIASSNPPVNYTVQTGNDGRVIIPGAPACSNSCYQITVSKPSYSTERTYSTTEVSTPSKPNPNVLTGALTEISFAIDLVSTLEVNSTQSRTLSFASLPNHTFTLRSDKSIGTDGLDNPVYKYTQNFTTDTNGKVTIPNLEWGTYQFIPTGTSYDISGTNSLLPVNIPANSSVEFKYATETHSANTLLAIFTDPADAPIASVTAQLIENGNPVATVASGLATDPDFGQSFFSSLSAQQYLLEATAAGFATYSATINIIGQTLRTIQLIPF